jgi:hypothetical protein
MQPAQRPTLAQNGAFLNIRMIRALALAGDPNLAHPVHTLLTNRVARIRVSVKTSHAVWGGKLAGRPDGIIRPQRLPVAGSG